MRAPARACVCVFTRAQTHRLPHPNRILCVCARARVDVCVRLTRAIVCVCARACVCVRECVCSVYVCLCVCVYCVRVIFLCVCVSE
jgi:hypothetical protein